MIHLDLGDAGIEAQRLRTIPDLSGVEVFQARQLQSDLASMSAPVTILLVLNEIVFFISPVGDHLLILIFLSVKWC